MYTDYYDVMLEHLNIVKKIREDLLVADKKVGVEVNAEKTKYTLMSDEQKAWST